VTKKNWRDIAILTFIISLLWGFVSIKLIIPYFSQGQYIYSPHLKFNIFDLIYKLISPSIKLKTVFISLLSFLFLPVFASSIYPALFLHFAHRFLMPGSQLWEIGFHYNIEIAPTLAVASVLGLAIIKRKLGIKLSYSLALLLIVVSIFLHRFFFKSPLGLAYNTAFYNHTKNFAFLDNMISKIPKNASVVAQNNLSSRFLHQDVWILRENYKQYNADYILFDLREGQNPINFLGMKDPKKLFETVKKDESYQLFYHKGDQYIFKKK